MPFCGLSDAGEYISLYGPIAVPYVTYRLLVLVGYVKYIFYFILSMNRRIFIGVSTTIVISVL